MLSVNKMGGYVSNFQEFKKREVSFSSGFRLAPLETREFLESVFAR